MSDLIAVSRCAGAGASDSRLCAAVADGGATMAPDAVSKAGGGFSGGASTPSSARRHFFRGSTVVARILSTVRIRTSMESPRLRAVGD